MNNTIVIILLLVLAGTGTVMGQNVTNARLATDQVQISVMIPYISKMMLLNCLDMITVTQSDIDRGYAEMPKAISFRVWSNSQGGSAVEAQLAGELQNENGDRLPAGDLQYRLTADEPYVPFDINVQKLCSFAEAISGLLVTMDIRLILAKGTKQGTYRYLPCFNLASL